jgi:hypothetical protein
MAMPRNGGVRPWPSSTYPVGDTSQDSARLPPQTGSVPIQLVGDLTVKDVTRRITWEATAELLTPPACRVLLSGT